MATDTPVLDGRDLALAFRAASGLRDRILDRSNRSFPEWVALRQLAEGPSVAREALVEELSRIVPADPATAARLLDDLEKTGLLEIADAVSLTANGEDVYRQLNDAFADLAATLQEGIEPAALETTRFVLRAITDRASTLARDLK